MAGTNIRSKYWPADVGGGLQAGISGRLPEEVAESPTRVEGAVRQVTVNAYECNPEARRRCIEAHGTACCICGFGFGAASGREAERYIHVHHVKPLSVVEAAEQVNTLVDAVTFVYWRQLKVASQRWRKSGCEGGCGRWPGQNKIRI